MSSWSRGAFLSAAAAAGHSHDHAKELWRIAERLQRASLPIVFDRQHLVKLTDADPEFLLRVETRRVDAYRHVEIRKRAGGIRPIDVPWSELLAIQTWIHRRILRSITLHQSAVAYRPGSSIRAAASRHTGARWLLKLDLANFFGSIDERRVFRVFLGLGYPSAVAKTLSAVATCQSTAEEGPRTYLPQGAPTSPQLANAVARALDRRLARLAEARGFVYTRYADDLALSTTDRGCARPQVVALLHAARSVVESARFSLNESKSTISPPGARKVVLGLLVNGPSPRLTRRTRRELLEHVRCLRKFGPASHMLQRGFASTIGMYEHIRGRISFARQVEPDFGAALARGFDEVEWPASLR